MQLNAGSGRIGGANAGEGNLISGNANNGVSLNIQTTGGASPVFVSTSSNYFVEGNLIGLNAGGTAALPNGAGGISVVTANHTIGGLAVGAGNVIAGNGTFGINLTGTTSVTPAVVATGNTIVGNRIGTNPAGTTAIANGGSGIGINNSANSNVIGGTAPGSRNLISGNGANGAFSVGVNMFNSHHNTVQGNLIGTNADGSAALPNANGGIEINNSNDNLVGGTTAAARNIISGNGSSTGQPGNAADGVGMFGTSANNQVQGNFIGTDVTGTSALANASDGVLINATGAGNVIGSALSGSPDPGAANTIAFNAVNGVGLSGSPSGVAIRGNSIFSNGSLGIDLGRGGVTANDGLDADTGPNGFQNFPVLGDVHSDGTVSGTLHSTPSTTFELDFYANLACETNGFGEGRRYLGSGSVGTDAGGNATFEFSMAPPAGSEVITVTATAAGGTSEFSACATPSANGQFVVTSTGDSGAGSLRQAMLDANAGSSLSTITFNISGSGPFTIQPATPLPTLTQPVTIDGFTQPGSSPNTAAIGTNAVMQIVVRGPGGSGTGFILSGGHSTIRGLVINGFTGGSAIVLFGATGNNTIEGNFIGTDATGTAAVPNGSGIASQSPDNLIGGVSLASRNLISGNSNQGALTLAFHTNGVITSIGSGTMFKNNLIGTAASGMTALPNNGGGLTMSAPNIVVGGTTAAERNVISGNGNTGISAFANVFTPGGGAPPVVVSAPSGLIVQGNFIGTTADGLARLPNNNGGVSANGPNTTIGGSAGTTPGGACTGACNLISGNFGTGVSLGNSFENNSTSPFLGTLFASATNSVIEGNYIGVDVNGNAPAAGTMGNSSQGVFVSAPGAQIGGGSPQSRNVISGNGSGNGSGISIGNSTVNGTTTVVANGEGTVVRGNYIGLNAAGTTAVPNNTGINLSVPNVRIGGTNAADRNVISGNQQWGINSFASTFNPGGGAPLVVLSRPHGLIVQGNYIGTTPDGLAAIGNSSSGINLNGAATIGGGTGTTPGGACTGACNLISGNGGNGLSLNHHTDNATSLTSAANSVIEGNYVGVNVSGTAALGNLGGGIQLGAADIHIGGGSPATRNVIGGNSLNNGQGINVGFNAFGSTLVGSAERAIIRGNYIGLRADGTGAIPNVNGINVSAPNVRIGGTTASDRNVISGNLQSGVNSFAAVPFNSNTPVAYPTGLIVQGNYIGTSPSGMSAMSNGGTGIGVSGGNAIIGGTTNVTVGGPCTGACNLVSGNGQQGISVSHSFDYISGTLWASAAGTTVAGNYVGLDVLGAAPIPNSANGINVNSPMVLVGGGTPEERNLVAGNTGQGISLGVDFTQSQVVVGTGGTSTISGNWVGFNAAGTAAFPNGQGGIGSGVPNVTIGGPNPGDGNVVIAGSFGSGINLYRSMFNEVLIERRRLQHGPEQLHRHQPGRHRAHGHGRQRREHSERSEQHSEQRDCRQRHHLAGGVCHRPEHRGPLRDRQHRAGQLHRHECRRRPRARQYRFRHLPRRLRQHHWRRERCGSQCNRRQPQFGRQHRHLPVRAWHHERQHRAGQLHRRRP